MSKVLLASGQLDSCFQFVSIFLFVFFETYINPADLEIPVGPPSQISQSLLCFLFTEVFYLGPETSKKVKAVTSKE